MGKQVGVFRISGHVGGASFYKSPFGDIVREKSGPTREMVLHREDFALTRRNAAEFQAAIQAAALLRKAFYDLLKPMKDAWLSGRMNGLLLKVIQTDMKNGRGERKVTEGDIELLQGFDFSKEHSLSTVFSGRYSSSIDSETGNMEIKIPAFSVCSEVTKNSSEVTDFGERKIKMPAEATHFRMVVTGVAVDFEKKEQKNDTQVSGFLLSSSEVIDFGELALKVRISESKQVLLLGMGVHFYRMENGNMVKVKGGAGRIVQVALKSETSESGLEHG